MEEEKQLDPEHISSQNKVEENDSLAPSLTEQSSSMEVHHHGHVHENKKWKEYLFQFFMLFLAVFCGSLAEYKLEHIIEHNREKEYISSLLHDLKQDTAVLAEVIKNNGSHLEGMDRMIKFSKKNLTDSNDLREFYRLNFADLSGFSVFKNNDATLSQLKFSGGLRLIKKSHAADSIVVYDVAIANSTKQRDLYVESFKNLWSSQQKILDLTLLADSSFLKTFELNTRLLPPITADKELMKQFYNQVMIYKVATLAYNRNQLQPLLALSARLISFLEKEYPQSD